MTDTHLYLAIGLPIVTNAAMLTLAVTLLSTRNSSLEARFELLTGKVAEFTDRVTRMEERMERR